VGKQLGGPDSQAICRRCGSEAILGSRDVAGEGRSSPVTRSAALEASATALQSYQKESPYRSGLRAGSWSRGLVALWPTFQNVATLSGSASILKPGTSKSGDGPPWSCHLVRTTARLASVFSAPLRARSRAIRSRSLFLWVCQSMASFWLIKSRASIGESDGLNSRRVFQATSAPKSSASSRSCWKAENWRGRLTPGCSGRPCGRR